MKIAIVHDWITGMRGGEWCLEAFLILYPEADVFTLVHIPGVTTQRIDDRVKQVSFLSRLPGIKNYYRTLLPLFPFAIKEFNFRGYDYVISISHAAAKNISVPKGTTHICYCLTPMRYIWDQAAQYLKQFLPIFWPLIKLLRVWDTHGAKSVSEFIGISKFVNARIRKFYARKSTVVYPPVASKWLERKYDRPYIEEYFLIAGALVPYKRIELAVEACTRAGARLIVAGAGPLEEKLKKIAGETVSFEGKVSDQRLATLYQHCKAFLFLAEEDFGIMPVEAMAAGKPVIARFVGAAKETIFGIKPWDSSSMLISEGKLQNTGLFSAKAPIRTQKELLAIIEQLKRVSTLTFDENVISKKAQTYAPHAFYQSWFDAIPETLRPKIEKDTFVAAFEKARDRVI